MRGKILAYKKNNHYKNEEKNITNENLSQHYVNGVNADAQTERIRTYFLTGLVKKFSPHREITRMANEKGVYFQDELIDILSRLGVRLLTDKDFQEKKEINKTMKNTFNQKIKEEGN